MANKLMAYGGLAHLWEIITGKFSKVNQRIDTKADRTQKRIEVPGKMMPFHARPQYAYKMVRLICLNGGDQRNASQDMAVMYIRGDLTGAADLSKAFPDGKMGTRLSSTPIKVWLADCGSSGRGWENLQGPVQPRAGTWIYDVPVGKILIVTVNKSGFCTDSKLTHVAVDKNGKVVPLTSGDFIRHTPRLHEIKKVRLVPSTDPATGYNTITRIDVETVSGKHRYCTSATLDNNKSFRHYRRFPFDIEWMRIRSVRTKKPAGGYTRNKELKRRVRWVKGWNRHGIGYFRIRARSPKSTHIKGEWRYFVAAGQDPRLDGSYRARPLNAPPR